MAPSTGPTWIFLSTISRCRCGRRCPRARLRGLAARLTDEQWQCPVGQHWTVSVVYAHLAFMDRRALWVLEASAREGKVVNPDFGIFVNDVSLPFWAAIPPQAAVRLAIEAAEAVDQRLEGYPPELLAL